MDDPSVAVIAPASADVTGVTVTANLPLVLVEAIFNDAGTDAAGFVSASSITTPPGGAGRSSVTVAFTFLQPVAVAATLSETCGKIGSARTIAIFRVSPSLY